jgi:hypothetical protein
MHVLGSILLPFCLTCLEITVFSDVMQCSLEGGYQCFRVTISLHKIEEESSSETLPPVCQTIQYHISEGDNLNIHLSKNLKSRTTEMYLQCGITLQQYTLQYIFLNIT